MIGSTFAVILYLACSVSIKADSRFETMRFV